ncbi:MAG: hypothetical protein LBQ34_07655 [Alphaproteobacteria bacterium]|jgi:hypothetical protein|nr:hypothetical protein [Alphaproteobacteria bacterium]
MLADIRADFKDIRRDIRTSIFGETTKKINLNPFDFLGYHLYSEQEDWLKFAFTRSQHLRPQDPEAKALFGARDYGKTAVITIYGSATQLEIDPKYTSIIFTRERTRGKAIMETLGRGLKKAGFKLKKCNTKEIRTIDNDTKEPSIFSTTPFSQDWRGMHVNTIIIEDIVIMQDRLSPTNREKTKKFYEECFNIAKNIIIIGQPVHKEDLYAMLKELNIPTKISYYGSIPELDKDLDLLRSQGMSEHDLQKNYFGELIPDGLTPFANIPVMAINFTSSTWAVIDPAFKGSDKIGIAIGVLKENGILYAEVFELEGDFYDLRNEITSLLRQKKVVRLWIEANDNGGAMRDMENWDTGITIFGYRSTKNKIDMIKSRVGKWANNLILQSNEYVNCVLDWNDQSKHDDGIDALGNLTNFITGNQENIKVIE